MVSRTELAAPRNKLKPTATHFGLERRVRRGGKADAAFGLRLLLSQYQPRRIHPKRDYLIVESC